MKSKPFFFNLFLFLFLFLLPTQFGKFFFFSFSYLSGLRIDYLSYAIFTTDIIALFLILYNYKKVVSFFKNKNVLLIFSLLAASIFFSFSPYIALYKFLKIVEGVSLFVVFKNIKISLKTLIYPIFLSIIPQLFLSIYQLLNKHSFQGVFYFLGERYFTSSIPGIAKASLGGVEILRPYGTFSHPNSMAGFFLLIYAFLLSINFGRKQVLKNLILFSCTLIILLTFSKTAILSLLLINLFYLFKNYKNSICKFCNVSRVFVIGILSFVFLNATTDPLSIFKRFELIQNSLLIITKYAITGVGLGNYLIAQDSLKSSMLLLPQQPVHNIFILLVSELGIFLGIYIIIALFKYFLQFKRIEALVFVMIVFFITGSLDHYWMTLQQNFLLVFVVFGIISNQQAVFLKSH